MVTKVFVQISSFDGEIVDKAYGELNKLESKVNSLSIQFKASDNKNPQIQKKLRDIINYAKKRLTEQ